MTSSSNRRARCKSCLLTLMGFSVPLALMALLLLGALSKELLELVLGRDGIETLSLYLVSGFQLFFFFSLSCLDATEWNGCSHCHLQTPVIKLFDSMTGEQQLYVCAGLVLLSFILLIIARFSFRYTAL